MTDYMFKTTNQESLTPTWYIPVGYINNNKHLTDLLTAELTAELVANRINKSVNKTRSDSSMKNNMKMSSIVNYTYDEKTGKTFIKWSDNTETTVTAENPEKADRFTGFMTAYAKRAAGNTSYINNLFDKWAVKKPIKDKIAEEKRIAQEAENKRIAEKHRTKREKYIIHKMALQRKREYEAKKLANEKYNIPMDED